MSGQNYDHNTSIDKTRRTNNGHVEVVGRAYNDDKSPYRRQFNENTDDKHQPIMNKPRAKIIKGN